MEQPRVPTAGVAETGNVAGEHPCQIQKFLMLALDVHTSQVPEMFQRFCTAIGEEHWRKRVRQCKQEMKGNVFLHDYLVRENDMAFQLDHLSELVHRFGRIPLAEAENHHVYPALALVAQTLGTFLDVRLAEHVRMPLRNRGLGVGDGLLRTQFSVQLGEGFDDLLTACVVRQPLHQARKLAAATWSQTLSGVP